MKSSKGLLFSTPPPPSPPKKDGKCLLFLHTKAWKVFHHQPPKAALHSPKRKNNSLISTMFSQPLYPVHLGMLVSGLLGAGGTGHLPFNPGRGLVNDSTRSQSPPTHMVAPGCLFLSLSEMIPALIGVGVEGDCFFLFFLNWLASCCQLLIFRLHIPFRLWAGKQESFLLLSLSL